MLVVVSPLPLLHQCWCWCLGGVGVAEPLWSLLESLLLVFGVVVVVIVPVAVAGVGVEWGWRRLTRLQWLKLKLLVVWHG